MFPLAKHCRNSEQELPGSLGLQVTPAALVLGKAKCASNKLSASPLSPVHQELPYVTFCHSVKVELWPHSTLKIPKNSHPTNHAHTFQPKLARGRILLPEFLTCDS